MILLEQIRLTFLQDRRSERTKPFAMFDPGVENVLHVRKAGMSEDRTIAQRTRSPFHPALKPSDDISVLDLFARRFEKPLTIQLRDTRSCICRARP